MGVVLGMPGIHLLNEKFELALVEVDGAAMYGESMGSRASGVCHGDKSKLRAYGRATSSSQRQDGCQALHSVVGRASVTAVC